MSRTTSLFASLLTGLVLTAPLFTAYADQPAAPSPDAHRPRARKKQAPLALPPLPAGPLRQVPMDQLPATAPKVTYQNGLLTIAAQNSTLGEILRDVRQLTGAAIELPPNGAPERVVTQLGPGAPRDVLALLLNGTAFNYVMLGSTSDPKAVATVVLTSKPSNGGVQTAANTFQPPPEPNNPISQPMPFRPGIVSPPVQPPAAAEADDNSDDSDADDKDDESDQPQQPVQAAGQPDAGAGNSPDQPGGPNGGPLTPEQVLQRLQRGQQPPQGFPQPPPQPQQ